MVIHLNFHIPNSFQNIILQTNQFLGSFNFGSSKVSTSNKSFSGAFATTITRRIIGVFFQASGDNGQVEGTGKRDDSIFGGNGSRGGDGFTTNVGDKVVAPGNDLSVFDVDVGDSVQNLVNKVGKEGK